MMEGKDNLSFWEHLDVLRGVLIKIALATVVCAVVAFVFKDEVFAIILAPKDGGFVTYRFFEAVTSRLLQPEAMQDFSVTLINTGLVGQFAVHVKIAICVGFLLSSPYALFLMFRFIAPALYERERRYTTRIVVGGYLMFMAGVLLNYFLIFPLTFRFLGTYQVSPEVENMIALTSYMDTLLMMCIMLGLMFELPVICWLFGRLGMLSANIMRRFRRHAVVVILVIAAIITPTSDIFTLMLVAFPVWLLYEVSILLVPVDKAMPEKVEGRTE